jgi:hypothetical protein
MNNVSQERLQTTLDVVGGAILRNALNRVTLNVTDGGGRPIAGATVSGDCGDGIRNLGESGADGIAVVAVPHATCDFTVTAGGAAAPVDDVPVAGDQAIPVSLTSGDTTVGGTVPPTLGLTLGAPASFGAFTPGLGRTYLATMTANVITTAGDALLSVADNGPTAPGHLVNGSFVLPQPLAAKATSATGTGADFAPVSGAATPLLTYPGPVTNDAVTLSWRQAIGANDPLRTGTYSKTLTLTLSTTSP